MDADAARLSGVDAARGLAVVGMLAAHLGPSWADPTAPWIWDLAQGPPSALFVLVTGIVVSRSRRPTRNLARRAAVLFVLGVALATLNPPVWVILQVTGCLLVGGALLRPLPTTSLAVLTAGVAVLGPLLVAAGREWSPGQAGSLRASDLEQPLRSVWLLLVTGAYPVVVWLLPLCAGLLLGRMDLTVRPRLWRLLALSLAGLALVRGLVAVAASRTVGDDQAVLALNAQLGGVPRLQSGWLLGGWPHAGTTLELASSVLAATAALAALCLLAPTGRALPLVAIGRIALTVYVAQVLVLTAWPELTAHAAGDAVLLVAAGAGASGVAAHLLLGRWSRGPLEELLHLATGDARRPAGNPPVGPGGSVG